MKALQFIYIKIWRIYSYIDVYIEGMYIGRKTVDFFVLQILGNFWGILPTPTEIFYIGILKRLVVTRQHSDSMSANSQLAVQCIECQNVAMATHSKMHKKVFLYYGIIVHFFIKFVSWFFVLYFNKIFCYICLYYILKIVNMWF